MGQYKGIFYNNKATHHFYEGGAHFSYFALVKVLEELKQKLDKESKKPSSESSSSSKDLEQKKLKEINKLKIPMLSRQKNQSMACLINNSETKGKNSTNKEKEENENSKDNDIDDNIKINEEIEKQEQKEEKKPKKISIKQKEKINIPLKSKRTFKSEDFEIISLSGKGAYGTVVKATLKSDPSNKLYAIKVMDIKALSRIKKLYQAYLECDILSQINNPYIVDIIGSFIEQGKIYIVMEYLSKGDFSDFIRLNFPLKIINIKFDGDENVNFLEYIQSKKIVHRNLKTENIIIKKKI